MKEKKTQTLRIIDGFVTIVVVLMAATLVASGVAVSRMNTEYMETGVRAAKITVERDSRQIFVSDSNAISLEPEKKILSYADTVLKFLPPPINTAYLTAKEIKAVLKDKQ